jgi:HSP20 family protein
MRYIQLTHPDTRLVSPSFLWGSRLAETGLENQIDWLFGTALAGFPSLASGGQFPVDLYQDKDNTYVRAELPGVARDAISVEIVNGSLSIQASRKVKGKESEENAWFSRLISLPDDVQADKVAASYENGVLTVTLPRKEESKPKKINIAVN